MASSRPACERLMARWDAIVDEFLRGGPAPPIELEPWASAYNGRGRGEVEWNALAEPFLGRLDQKPRGVFLALNPGAADLGFQGRSGTFAHEIRKLGSYSAWAASWPYLRSPWEDAKGKNRHHRSRLRFLRNWHDTPTLEADSMVSLELYPWHSPRITGRFRVDPDLVRAWIWEPLAELDAPVFAFGAPWFGVLSALNMRTERVLGTGGDPYGSQVSSRTVAVIRDRDTGVRVIAEKHRGSAVPPSREETVLLRKALTD